MKGLKRCYNLDNSDNYPSKVILLETKLFRGNPEDSILLNSIINGQVSCNFTPVSGHVYHLYERLHGQRYLGMLSPLEWQSPHTYLGSYLYENNIWLPVVCNS